MESAAVAAAVVLRLRGGATTQLCYECSHRVVCPACCLDNLTGIDRLLRHGAAESHELRKPPATSPRLSMTPCLSQSPCHQLVLFMSLATLKSWSLRASGQASVRDIVCVCVCVPIALSTSLATLNPGACGHLGRRQSMTSCVCVCVHRLVHVIGYAESWSLRVSGQASVHDIVSVSIALSMSLATHGYAESWSLRVSGQASVHDIVSVSIALSMSLATHGYAESWSLRVSGQASVRDIVSVSVALSMSLATHSYAESWSLRVSGQASVTSESCLSPSRCPCHWLR